MSFTISNMPSKKHKAREYHYIFSRSITLYIIAYPLRATTFFTKSITTGEG